MELREIYRPVKINGELKIEKIIGEVLLIEEVGLEQLRDVTSVGCNTQEELKDLYDRQSYKYL